jgi:hypothetical protein
MSAVALYHIDPSRNMRRFYRLDVQAYSASGCLAANGAASAVRGERASCPSPLSTPPRKPCCGNAGPKRGGGTRLYDRRQKKVTRNTLGRVSITLE